MRAQLKVAFCSFFIFIICVIISFFFVCYKDLYIEKWFDYILGISLGLMTNASLILAISIITFYQIRRENARRIFIELNIFQEAYAMLNTLILPHQNGAGEICIPDSDLQIVENSLSRLDDISIRTLYLNRISLPINFLNKMHLDKFTRIVKIEDSFYRALSEFINQCHIANNAFRLAYSAKDEPTRELSQLKLQSSFCKIIEFSSFESAFIKNFNAYLEINKTILGMPKQR